MARDPLSALHTSRGITARLGPTNTGKTHHAIRRMLGHRTGMIGLPLRLLAREVYDRVVAEVGPQAVALVTGEEKVVPPRTRFWVCTVESMPVDRAVDFVCVDEIQLATDPARGHVFTDRLLHSRGAVETWFLGADTMGPWLDAVVPSARVVSQPRLSTLSYAGAAGFGALPKRSAVVAFTATDVYDLAERLRVRHGGVAVVLGALSPRVRNAQVALYQSGEVPFLVATDAIGMGLNMDVHHVALAADAKFDGRRHRRLRDDELAQIAGRAGRWRRDGTFGETAGLRSLAPETVDAITGHRFVPVDRVYWRNADLDRGSIASLRASLSAAPPRRDVLMRAPPGDDERALEALSAMPDVTARATDPSRVALLWEVCGVPDFGNVLPEHHAGLLAGLYQRLVDHGGQIPDPFVGGHLARLDRTDGDASTLMSRLAAIRTWNFLAHRPGWVSDGWEGRAREVEDRLGDALHAALTARFVDRRGRVWSRRAADGAPPTPEVDAAGVVAAAGEVLGRLDGLRFEPASDVSPRAQSVARGLVRPLVLARLAALEDDPTALSLTVDGSVCAVGGTVGRLVRGDDWRRPGVRAVRTDLLDGSGRGRLAAVLDRWRVHWLDARLGALGRVVADEPAARGLVAALAHGLGVVPRAEIDDLLRAIGPAERRALRAQGVRVGRRWAWHEALVRALPRRATWWALHHGGEGAGIGEGIAPFAARLSPAAAAALGVHPWGRGWLRADVAELAWEDPARAARVYGLDAAALADGAMS